MENRPTKGSKMPAREPLRLLLVEDDMVDAELVVDDLMRGGFHVEWERVDTEQAFSQALDQAMDRPWDVVVSDFAMPGFSGMEAFEALRAHGTDTPFIFVSGALGEERAVEAMRAGAKDYFLKGNLARLASAVRREVTAARNRRQQRQAEEAVLREQKRLALAVEASGAGVFEINLAGGAGAVDYAGRWAGLLGHEIDDLPKSAHALVAWFSTSVHPDDKAATLEGMQAFFDGRDERHDTEFRVRDGAGRWVDVAAFGRVVARAADGTPARIAGVVLDLSARKLLEAQLRQSQKMEAVGQLASGVAHDFNNLLTAILSFATFAMEELRPGGPVAKDLQEVLKAARRAQSVTAQLLALSRRKTVVSRVVEVGEVVDGTGRILRRLLGEDIDLRMDVDPNTGSARVDPDAIGQIVLNLAVNARDAMPRGGRLTVDTQNVTISDEDAAARGGDARAGDFVVLMMSDSGIGMTVATMARIFEPFFTTKDPGQGTGLGLSMCREIVKQAEGFIEVDSALGAGTTFRVYLPRFAGPADVLEKQVSPTDLRGVERVLIAEDDEQVRVLARRVLSRAGYTVVDADNGQDALDEMKRAGAFDLLLTNLVMPIMSGPQLVEEARALYPGMRVLLMSGHNAAALAMTTLPDTPLAVLQKPFTPDLLAQRVRQVLDEGVVLPARS